MRYRIPRYELGDDAQIFTEKWEFYKKVSRERREGLAKFIIFENLAIFHNWHERVNEKLGIPMFLGERAGEWIYEFGRITTTGWAEPNKHVDSKDDRVWAIATPAIQFEHTLVDRDELLSQGFVQD